VSSSVSSVIHEGRRRPSTTCCSVVELHQYTLHPNQRDVYINLFDRHFVHSQEAVGICVVGQCRDLDDADRFVWVRGFRDMSSRAVALASFYGGPVWQAYCEAANATMVDSSNALLLTPAAPSVGFPCVKLNRPRLVGEATATSRLQVTIYDLGASMDVDFVRFFERHVKPVMERTGGRPVSYFQTETAFNTFPAVPIRTGNNFFVWFSTFRNQDRHRDHVERLAGSQIWRRRVLPELLARLRRPPQQLNLEPTTRSRLR
jgi:hypothetical protein